MSDQDEYVDDRCIVLPKNYLNSAEAVAEIYEAELSAATNNFDVDQLSGRRFLQGVVLVPLLWALSGIWTVCQ